jgi:DNA polymerase-1
MEDSAPFYMSWGHPTNNNCTEDCAKQRVIKCLLLADKIICHNAPFDLSIIEEVWGIAVPWEKVEDTMVMAFIDNPHGELSLKPLAELHLDMPPEERDAVKEWLINHGVCRDTKGWGAYIAYAPGDLVGKYAIGDVERTYRLYQFYMARMATKPKVLAAYRQELALMPHILHMDQRGVNIDVAALAADTNAAYEELEWLDEQINTILGREIDVDKNDELADAIEAAGLSKGFGTTATGKRSVAKDSLLDAVADPTLLGHLLVRNSLATCIRTFMHPWLVQARKTGRLYIKFNQVRNYDETGARTGRLSSSPNLQNVPDKWEKLQTQLDSIGYALHKPMPRVRKYIIAESGEVLIGRDYSGQEMRLLAHFAGGQLLELLQKQPEADVHLIAAEIAGITRKVAKTLGFAVLYGAGVGKIAESLYVPVEEATRIKAEYLAALPEIKELQYDIQRTGRRNDPINTLGGRQYYVEKAKVLNGLWKTFEYKLTNYLIQGSAADQTKRAMLEYCRNSQHGRLVLSVHDELVISCPIEHADAEAKILEAAMNSSYAETLDYTIISTEARGHSYADLE